MYDQSSRPSTIQDNYDEMEEEELEYMVELITWQFDYSTVYDQIKQIVSNYNDGQYDDELDESSDLGKKIVHENGQIWKFIIFSTLSSITILSENMNLDNFWISCQVINL